MKSRRLHWKFLIRVFEKRTLGEFFYAGKENSWRVLLRWEVAEVARLQLEKGILGEFRYGMFQEISNDWRSHDRDWTRPGFRAIAVYRFGVWRMTIRSKLVRAPFSMLYRCLFRYVRNHYGIELPCSAQVGKGVVIEHQGCIVIHGSAIIGDGCIIRQGVTLGNKNLDQPHDAPRLGNRVNVGAGAKILGAVNIGDDAVIGANAVVLKDVPAGMMAVGVPARIREID